MAANRKHKFEEDDEDHAHNLEKRSKLEAMDLLPLLRSKDITPGKHLQLFPLHHHHFYTFIQTFPKLEVVSFFKTAIAELEKRHIRDFHLKIKDDKDAFCIDVFYGEQREGPEYVAPGSCISCFSDAILFPGLIPKITSGACVLKEFSDQPYVLCSIDAKARGGFIITPVRHVEKVSELDDEELFALLSVAVRALRKDDVPFMSMVLNHGSYRNLPHLHLKVWVDEKLHKEARLKWSKERIDLWEQLMELARADPNKRPCRFFKEKGWCKYGKDCKFLHSM